MEQMQCSLLVAISCALLCCNLYLVIYLMHTCQFFLQKKTSAPSFVHFLFLCLGPKLYKDRPKWDSLTPLLQLKSKVTFIATSASFWEWRPNVVRCCNIVRWMTQADSSCFYQSQFTPKKTSKLHAIKHSSDSIYKTNHFHHWYGQPLEQSSLWCGWNRLSSFKFMVSRT